MSSHRSRSKTISKYLAPALSSQSKSTHPTKSPLMKADPNWFDDVFRCYICLQNLTSPTLCPKCSKLCCDPCIKKWLRERKEECPHCRAHIDQTHLVPCRFLDDIQEQIKLFSVSNSEHVDLCPEHKTRMTYYCHTCQKPICSDCGMFGDKHRDHEFEKLEKIYEQRIDGLQSYLEALRKRMAKFTKKIKEVDRKVQNCNLAKVEADRELVGLVNRYRTNLELQLREKHAILFSQRATLVKQGDFLLATIAKLDDILSNKSQVEVLQSDEKVIDILKQVEQVILHNPGDDASVDMTFEKDFLPSYDLYRFRIPNFRLLVNESGNYESSAVSQGGLVWHLRASIESVNEKNGGYLALFIKLAEGDPSSSRYYIRVEMKHSTRSDSVIREFCFDLKAGDTRGFRQFCRIQTILSKGFINPANEYLELVCGVRPLSYRQRCRDQRRYIQDLEARLSQLDPNSKQPFESSGELVSTYREVQPIMIQASVSEAHTATPDNGVLSGSATDDAYGEELVGSSDAMLVPSPARPEAAVVEEVQGTDEIHRTVDNSRYRSASLSNNGSRPISPFDPDSHQLPITDFISHAESSLQGTSNHSPSINLGIQSQYLRRPAKNALTRVEPRGFLITPSSSRHTPRRTHQRAESHQVNAQLSRQVHKNKRHDSENSSDSEYDDEMDQCAAIPPFTSAEELRQLIHQEFDSWSGNLSALGAVPRSSRAPPTDIRLPTSRLVNTTSPGNSSPSSGISSNCPTPGQNETINDSRQEILAEAFQNQANAPTDPVEALPGTQTSILDPNSTVSSPPPIDPLASPSDLSSDIILPTTRARHRSHSSAACYLYSPSNSVYPPNSRSYRS